MEGAGSSLFTGGSLHFEGVSVQPGSADAAEEEEEEEAEAAEEEERRNRELQNVLKDAFDDLIEEDEDASLNNTGDPSFHPEKYPTSTPFTDGKERSLYDELGGQLYNLPRMSDPCAGRPAGSGDYYTAYPGDYRDSAAGAYHGDGAGYQTDATEGYPAGSDGEYDPESRHFLTLRPEETNNGVTEMINTPRQHLDTSTDSSAAHYRHCYVSPRHEVDSPPPEEEEETDDQLGSEDMVARGLRLTETAWHAARHQDGHLADPGKFVANRQKDLILARTSRDQLETLYEARGHEIGRLRSELERVRSETAAELRQARHQATLAAADRQALETSLQQARHLLVEKEEQIAQLRGEIESLKIQLQASEEAKKDLCGRLQSAEVTVASLETQLTELQRSEALARNTERHQHVVDGLQSKHQQELAEKQHRVDALIAQLENQTSLAASLQKQLDESEQARHRLAADKGDVINQLTAGLEAAQARCRQLMQGDTAQLRDKLSEEESRRQQTEQQLREAQEQVASLQRDLDACESVLRLGVRDDTQDDPGMTSAPQSTPVARPSGSDEPSPFSLRRELMRAMETARSRREEMAKLRSELSESQRQLRQLTALQAEKDAQLATLRDKVQEIPPADQDQTQRLSELQQQLATEQNKRKLADDQLRKIKHEGEKLHKTAEELRRHMAEQVEEADRVRLQAVEEVRQACLQLHDDMMNKLRAEKVEEYEAELEKLRTEVKQTQQELVEVKDLYVKVCQEKDKLEQEYETERQAAAREREAAVRTALDQHYDKWYADWRRSQQAAVTEAVQAERRRLQTEVGSAGTQTSPRPSSAQTTQTDPESPPPPPPPPPPPDTSDQAVQQDDQQVAQQLDKLKKRLKRACIEKKKLEASVQELTDYLKQATLEFEEKIKKERQECERKVRETRRRSPSGGETDLVKTLRQQLNDRDAQLKKLTQLACEEKDELITTYESRLRVAIEQDQRLVAAAVTGRRTQLTADQLTAECAALRAELDRLRSDHETQTRQREQTYQQSLNSYRQLIDNKVAELTQAEEELRHQSEASAELMKNELARLTADNVRLSESYEKLLAQRQADRENFEKQVRQLATESDSSDSLRLRVADLESKLRNSDSEIDRLRERLRAGKEKLQNYHGYVKEREQHYDAEFRRLEAEYRVAVGKMKEKVMLARERSRPAAAAAVQTEVGGEELSRALGDMAGLQVTLARLRLELSQVVDRHGRPERREPAELPTYRSHARDPARPPVRAAGLRWTDTGPTAPLSAAGLAARWSDPRPVPGQPEPAASLLYPYPPAAGGGGTARWSDTGRTGQLSSSAATSLGRPESGLLSGQAVSSLGGQENPLASLERIRRDLNYIFHREASGGDKAAELAPPAGQRTAAGEQLLARLARLPLTPPSRDDHGVK